MERLTSYKSEYKREMICRYKDCDTCEEYCPHLNEDNCPCLQEVLEKLAKYEDATEELNAESIQRDFNATADSILEYVCENLCKIPVNRAYTQDDVDAFCDKCKLEERVKSLKDTYQEFCAQVDKLYLQKCAEVNALLEKLKDFTNFEIKLEGNTSDDDVGVRSAYVEFEYDGNTL